LERLNGKKSRPLVSGRDFALPRNAARALRGCIARCCSRNARWRGVPLKAVPDKAGVQQGAKQITLQVNQRFGVIWGLQMPAKCQKTANGPR
jgi:hypothetical protein